MGRPRMSTSVGNMRPSERFALCEIASSSLPAFRWPSIHFHRSVGSTESSALKRLFEAVDRLLQADERGLQLDRLVERLAVGRLAVADRLQVVDAFRRASGKEIRTKVVARRPGDVGSCYADPRHAQRLLGWKANLGLEEMCADAWRWQSSNPAGYP